MPVQQRRMMPLQFTGLNTDKSPDILEPNDLTTMLNAYSRESITRVNGKEAIWGTTLFSPLWVLNSAERASGDPAWIYTANDGFAVVVGGTHNDITPLGGIVATNQRNAFTGGELNGVPVWNQPAEFPYFWDGVVANPAAPIPGWPVNQLAGFLRPYKFHLVAGLIDPGVGQFDPDLVVWSDRAIPGAIPTEWVPSATNEAGSVSIGATPGVVIDALALRGSLYIYKSTSTYRLTYVGGAQVMRSELVFPESGMMGRNCVAALNTFHCVLTDNDVVVHDGQNLRSIANDRIRRDIFARIDPDNFPNSFVLANSNEREFWICIPEVGSTYPSIAYVWNAPDDAWGIRELTETPPHIAPGRVIVQPPDTTWDGQVGDWDSQVNRWDTSGVVVGRYDLLSAGFFQDQLYLLEQTALDDGAAVQAVVQRVTLDLGEPESVKFLKAVWLSVDGTAGTQLRVRVAGQLQPQDPIVWGDYLSYVVASGQRKVDTSVMGRFLSLEISSIEAQDRWRVPDVTLEIERSGLY